MVSCSTVIGSSEPTAQQIEDQAITYEYDHNGNITDVDYAFRTNGITGLHYIYDANRRIKRIEAKDGLINDTVRKYEYDTFGRVSEVKDYYDTSGLGECITRSYTYDAFGRLSGISYADSGDGEVKEAYLYTYDKNSRIIWEESATAYTGSDVLEEKIRDYTYDANGRLIRTEISDGDPAGTESEIHTYSYDAVGNRTGSVIDGTQTTYTYNSLDELISETAVSEGETVSNISYTYDRNGNRVRSVDSVKNEIVSMQYNASDMMKRCELKEDGDVTLVQENTYDSEGQRIRRKETDTEGDSPVITTRNYLYQDGSLLGTTDAQGTEVSFNLLTPGGNIVSTAREDSGGNERWYLYNKDDQGSTTSLIDDTGSPVALYDYDEYGNTEIVSGGDFENDICYTGQVYDRSTGLHYYNARYYDSQTGSFTTQDTYRGEAVNPLTLNLYAYCAGDPINHTDPTGHSWLGRFARKIKKAWKAHVVKPVKRRLAPVKRFVVKTYHAVRKAVRPYYRAAKRAVKKAWTKGVRIVKRGWKQSPQEFRHEAKKKIKSAVTGGITKKKHFGRNKNNKNIPPFEVLNNPRTRPKGWLKAGSSDNVCHSYKKKKKEW